MPVTPYSARVQTAEDLEDALNALLAPLLSNFIYGVEIDQIRSSGPSFLRNILALFTASSGGTPLSDPFKFKTFVSADESTSITLANQFIAANPTFFFSQVFGVTRPTEPDPNQGVIFGVFYCEDAVGAAANWSNVPASSDPEYTGTLALGANVVNSIPLATAGAAMWYLELVKGTQRYSSTVNAVHNGTNAYGTEGDVTADPTIGVLPFTIDVDVSGANMRLTIDAAEVGWDYRVRRQSLTP